MPESYACETCNWDMRNGHAELCGDLAEALEEIRCLKIDVQQSENYIKSLALKIDDFYNKTLVTLEQGNKTIQEILSRLENTRDQHQEEIRVLRRALEMASRKLLDHYGMVGDPDYDEPEYWVDRAEQEKGNK